MVSLALRTGAVLFTLFSPMLSLKRRIFGVRTLETENGKRSVSTQDSPETLNSSFFHLERSMNGDTFEEFWDSVLEYSELTGLSTEYLEEEFIINGELIKVNINYKKETK
jgi:hypothetical protein